MLDKRRQPSLVLIAAALTLVISAAVCVGALLVHAPPAVVPLVVAVCIGGPVFASWDVPIALASVRADRALARLRTSLERLPETEHPLGL